MPGVRIHHATLRNAVILIRHPGEIKKTFKTYNKGRKPKDYRIQLDNEGNCIVSEVVWKRLQEAGAKDFIILNEVADPPRQTLSFKEGTFEEPATYRMIGEALKEIAPPGVKAYVRRHSG